MDETENLRLEDLTIWEWRTLPIGEIPFQTTEEQDDGETMIKGTTHCLTAQMA